MKVKRNLMIVAAIVAMLIVLATGITLAVDNSINGSTNIIRTAYLDLAAKTSNHKVFTAVATTDSGDGVFTDENGVSYKYEQSSIQNGSEYFFVNGGSVKFEGKNVSINKMAPGDKVEFDIEVTSDSNISFNYRAELSVDDENGKELIKQLEFSAGDMSLRPREIEDDGRVRTGVLTDYTEWTTVAGNRPKVETIHVSISLPMTAIDGDGESVVLSVSAYGVSMTEDQPDVAEVVIDGETNVYKYLSEAVDAAIENGVDTVRIVNGTVLEEGTINVNRALKFVGTVNEYGAKPILKGARISVSEASSASFENVNFGGESYIDVSDADSLTLRGCSINIEAVKFFDTNTKNYLSDAAFIVSGASYTPVLLNVSDCEFTSDSGSAICMLSQLQDGSVISNNTFGKENKPFDGSAVLVLNSVVRNGSVRLQNNNLFGKLPVMLNGNTDSEFRFVSLQNNADGVSVSGIFAQGRAKAAFLDSGSKINGLDITLKNIDFSNMLFGGVKVRYASDSSLLISGGSFELANEDVISQGEFYTKYVAGGTLETNAIEYYVSGALFGYINSANNANGYILTPANSQGN